MAYQPKVVNEVCLWDNRESVTFDAPYSSRWRGGKDDLTHHFFIITQGLDGLRILFLKKKIMSSFTHAQVVANLKEFLSSAEHIGRYFEEWLELWYHWLP